MHRKMKCLQQLLNTEWGGGGVNFNVLKCLEHEENFQDINLDTCK